MKKKIILLSILLLTGLFFIWQDNDIVITSYEYSSEKISNEFDGFKIVQISDLHNKRFGKGQKRILKQIQEEEPDIIVVTGDLVDSSRTNFTKAMELIQGAVDIASVYYVTGNHEKWLSSEEQTKLTELLCSAGVRILEDEKVKISKDNSDFLLMGLDDEHLKDDTLHNLMEGKGEEFVLLLAHEPQYLENYRKEGVDLVLSGHAHGGQFRIPGLGGLIAPDQGWLPKYTSGKHKDGQTTMFISRGLGNSMIPIRVFNRPEIITITLKTS